MLFALLVVVPAPASGATLPSGFRDTVAIGGVDEPTAVRFAPDGKVFIAQKSGKILVYDSLADNTPTLFADLRTEVYNANDRGLLGLALDPQFPAEPYVYVLYAFDAPIGGVAPVWGKPGEDGDGCPDPPGANTDGCVISGRLSRLKAEGDHSVAEKVLVNDWCQQFSSHSVGDLQFDSDGNLLASGGDGASFNSLDYGQYGEPLNPCGDPPAGIGGKEESPTAEGGALRSQNPKKLNGSIIRVDPDTGEGVAGNPLASSLTADANERRILAKGFRNPFRFALDPQTGEIYVANVGSSLYEEIDRFAPSATLYNSGWPCYEGPHRRELYEALNTCQALYKSPGSVSEPLFYYSHTAGVTPEDPCPYEPGSAISGMAFYEVGAYPAKYDGALFFADSVRGCIYVMRTDDEGRPDPLTVEPFLTEGGLYPGVDIEVGPEGDLYYASLYGEGFGPGAIHKISYDSDAPQARLETDSPTWGGVPLTVEFDASESTDPQGESLEYEWDLDGNGKFTAPTPDGTKDETYEDPSENKTATIRVIDQLDHSSVDQVVVYPGDTPPVPKIKEPTEALKWTVGQPIEFAGSASDKEEAAEEIPPGEVPTARLYWRSQLFHCPGGPESCHGHPLQVFPAVKSGTLIAPDHELPSHIDLTLTATDARGLSASKTVSVYPRVASLSIESDPPGVTLTVGEKTAVAPFPFTAIEGSKTTLSAPQTAELNGTTYNWTGWSDGGARDHAIVAEGSAVYTADYENPEEPPEEEEPPIEEETTKEEPAKPLSGGKETPPLILAPPSILPGISLTKHPSKKTAKTVASFTFSSSAPGFNFECKRDHKPFTPCTSPRTYKHLRPGKHVFQVVAVDSDGGVSSPAVYKWKVLRAKR